MLTTKQRRLQGEIKELLDALRITPDVSTVSPEWRTTHLELAKRSLIIGAVLREYLLVDEFLGTEIARDFFPRRKFAALWRTKKFRAFNYHVLERLYLPQKLDYLRVRRNVPKQVYRDIMALNDLRNALAHSYFPENRRVKPLWKGQQIFSTEGFESFLEDMGGTFDYLYSLLARYRRHPIV
jgi:hypothetical protein